MALLLLFRPRGTVSAPTGPYGQFFGGPFFGGGFFGPLPPTGTAPAGGDSTRLKPRRRRGRIRYWWEKDDPKEIESGLEKVTVLTAEQALLDPVVVEALWEEQARLNEYIVEMSFSRSTSKLVDKLREVDQWIQARIDAENARKLRIRKKIMLLLGGD
jgi:hypothetical protein